MAVCELEDVKSAKTKGENRSVRLTLLVEGAEADKVLHLFACDVLSSQARLPPLQGSRVDTVTRCVTASSERSGKLDLA